MLRPDAFSGAAVQTMAPVRISHIQNHRQRTFRSVDAVKVLISTSQPEEIVGVAIHDGGADLGDRAR